MTPKVGILETGAPPCELKSRFGSYVDMLQRLLGPSFYYVSFDARQEQLPSAPAEFDALVLTGSAAGVYDGDRWIEALKTFISEASEQVPLVGICFGHQVMAEAFGGRVNQATQGWGIGCHQYEIHHRTVWMDSAQSITVPVSHRDQVVALPTGAVVLAGSAFTPFGVLLYPERRALSFQCHPEFSVEYAQALIELRRGRVYSDAQVQESIASLLRPNDGARVAEWIRHFIAGQVG
jgi:GMP synthase-like glutamine amidotransferase